MNNTIAIILAGGSGERFGMTKQFVSVHNIPVFIYTLITFKQFTKVITVPEEYKDIAENGVESNIIGNAHIINGGQTRQKSVLNALKYIHEKYPECKNVIITDANRPCLSQKTIDECLKLLETNKAVVTACRSINTSCLSANGKYLAKILDRTYQYDLLMPQCFRFKELYHAHVKSKNINATDDYQILKKSFPKIKAKLLLISFWEGLKLTKPTDYKVFELLLEKK